MSDVRVRVADMAVGNGDTVISSVGLGSCVAITLYDPSARVGGLAHILLPSRAMSRDAGNPAKFPETAVPAMIDEMRRRGARGPFVGKLVGGASMFASLLPAGGINMGERNAAASRAALERHGIPIVGEDTGGDYGRSVYLHLADGRVIVRSIRGGDRVL